MTVLQMSDPNEDTDSRPPKRPRYSYQNSETPKSRTQAWINDSKFTSPFPMPSASETMVNGYGLSDSFHQAHAQRSPEENGYNDCHLAIAPLVNLGNTCFLNSVLYTLRFAPSFLHKLHHLNSDADTFTKHANKPVVHSLGRNLGKTASWGNKDSFSCTSKLHHLYQMLSNNEYKDRMEPFHPTSFLHALREVNPMFEGNQQHDAHELLVCLLDTIREACDIVYQQNGVLERQITPSSSPSTSSAMKKVLRTSLKFSRLLRDKGSNGLRENHSESDIKKYLVNGDLLKEEMEEQYISNNTIFEDFQGVSLLRTMCLECEQVTERKETFCDICVPIKTVDDCDETAVIELYHSVIVTEEFLIESNKYWCEKCTRYNEAKRCVKYEKLPRLLTLHLKRFSSGFGSSVSKVNDYMPTPFTLTCFCEECVKIKDRNEEPSHTYSLYAIIMHLGAALASGHYVAYVRTLENMQEYQYCTRDKPKTTSLSRGSSISSVGQNNGSINDKGIRKYFNKLSSKSFSNGSANSSSARDADPLRDRKPTCKGTECCSVRMRGISPCDHDATSSLWLECDDETVRTISTQELLEIMAPKSNKNATTPYLLFYTRVDS